MSLMFSIIMGMCEDTLQFLDDKYSPQHPTWSFINYDCGVRHRCDIQLTGPSWMTALKLAVNNRKPKVRMYDTR